MENQVLINQGIPDLQESNSIKQREKPHRATTYACLDLSQEAINIAAILSLIAQQKT